MTEKHITCVKKPGYEYFGHIAVLSEDSQTIASGVINFFNDKNIIPEVLAEGCKGTVVNTGRKNYIISLLE